MRLILTFLIAIQCCFLGQNTLQAQVDTNKVYSIAEQMPLIPNCANYDTTYAAKQKCSQDLLLNFIYKNVQYPDSARLTGIEGTVVISFVIGRDSLVRDAKVVKDIGGGCGAAALYVINAMNPLNLRWVPGKIEGIPVDVRRTMPVKFKIKELPPYVLMDGDTVYTEFEKPLSFKGGEPALAAHIEKTLQYPSAGNDNCSVGTIEVKAIIAPNEPIGILEMHDFNSLGMDFQFEAISTVNATIGQWDLAEYKGRTVPTSYLIRLDFKPNLAQCQNQVSAFEKAQVLAIEGSNLFNQGEQETGIAKLEEAVALFPRNAEFLYAKGQAHLELKNMEQACEDLSKVKEILLVSWVDNLLPLICNPALQEATEGN